MHKTFLYRQETAEDETGFDRTASLWTEKNETKIKDSHLIWWMFSVENNWWWTNMGRLIFQWKLSTWNLKKINLITLSNQKSNLLSRNILSEWVLGPKTYHWYHSFLIPLSELVASLLEISDN